MVSTTPDSSIDKVAGDATSSLESTNAPENVLSESGPKPQDTELSETSEDAIVSNTDTGEIVTETLPLEHQAEGQATKPLSKFEEALYLRDKLDSLIRRTVQTKKRCEKLDHDNKYLQDYVGNLMNSGDFLSKRV